MNREKVSSVSRSTLAYPWCGYRGGLVFKAHRWLYHSTLGSRVINKKKKHIHHVLLGEPRLLESKGERERASENER